MEARVYLVANMDLTVTVQLPDDTPPDRIEELAIEQAMQLKPATLCASCSGWGRSWSRDEGPYEALDNDPVEVLK